MRRRTITAVIAGSISTAALLALAVPGATTAAPPRCTVVMGASIADGYRADPGTNWPTVVDQRLTARNPRGCIRNRSVSATRLLLSLPQLPSYLEREPAVLQAPQPSEIVLTDLINDIQALPHQYDPTTIIDGIRRFVAAAHEHGIRVVATTIPPYGGYRYTAEQSYSTAGEHCRQAVNAALRQGGLVDGVIDFDRALADPAHPSQLRLAYDSGDHLHPSTAGQQAMADTAAAALQRTTEPSEVTRSYSGRPVPGTPAPALPPGPEVRTGGFVNATAYPRAATAVMPVKKISTPARNCSRSSWSSSRAAASCTSGSGSCCAHCAARVAKYALRSASPVARRAPAAYCAAAPRT